MEEVSSTEKKNLAQKLREFQLGGLKSYGKYLDKELANAQTDIKRSYRKYIENEIIRNAKKMEEVQAKIDSY